jgi:hypothetical protein
MDVYNLLKLRKSCGTLHCGMVNSAVFFAPTIQDTAHPDTPQSTP